MPAKEWALVGLNGNDIYSEPRGLLAGYNWPQYAVHRGLFHVLLYDTFVERAGADAVRLGCRVTGYENNADGTVTAIIAHADGNDLARNRHAADRRRRHPLRRTCADASGPAADPLGRRDHVARHDAGETDPAPARPSSDSARIASAW